MLFLAVLGLIGLVAIVFTALAVLTDGYAPVQTRSEDGFAPDTRYTPSLKGDS